MIPEILHFIWIDLDGQGLPARYIRNLEIARRNTNCHLVLHTNLPTSPLDWLEIRSLNLEKSIEHLREDVGQGKRVAHYSDILRLDILYKEGGIYSDLDVLWLRNPWDLYHHKLFIGFDNKAYKILCNAVLGSEAGHPALLQYKEWLESIYPCTKYWIPANPYKLWKSRTDVKFLEKYVFFPCNYKNRLDSVKWEKSTAIHLYESSHREECGEIFEILNRYARGETKGGQES